MTKKKTLTKKQSIELYTKAMKNVSSQAKLAELMGVTQATVSCYKKGKTILQGPALRIILMMVEIPAFTTDKLKQLNESLSEDFKIEV